MAVETAPARDAFALSEEERQVRDTVRDWAQREVAPGAAERDDAERYDRTGCDLVLCPVSDRVADLPLLVAERKRVPGRSGFHGHQSIFLPDSS